MNASQEVEFFRSRLLEENGSLHNTSPLQKGAVSVVEKQYQ